MTDIPDEGPLIEQLELFGRKIDNATEEIVALTERLDLIKTKADTAAQNAATAKKYATTSRRLARVGVAALIVAVAVGIGTFLAVATNRDSIDDIESSRAEARVVTCDNHNALLDLTQAAIVRAASKSLVALVPAGQEITPEQQVRLDAYTEALTRETTAELAPARRDCSPEGIAAFYEGR